MSFFPGKDPAAGDKFQCDAIKARDRAAHRRSRRRLHRAPRAAVGAVAHGRPVRVLRSFRADGVQVRQRPRRAAASAYRARHRHLSVRRRDHAPRQPRHRRADPAGRGQLDDRRPRHRAFRAHRYASAAPKATACTACRCGWRCRRRQEEMAPDFAHHAVEQFPVVRDNGKTVRVVVGSAYGARSPVKTTSETLFADVHLKAGSTLPLDADHEERAIYVLDGEIDIAGDRFGGDRLLVFKPGDRITVRALTDAHFDDLRRRADGWPAPHLVEFRVVAQGPHRAGQGRMDRRPLPEGAGRRDRVHPAAGEIVPLYGAPPSQRHARPCAGHPRLVS